MSVTERLKLAVVTPIPTPYRDGFWNVLAARDDVDLSVYYCAAGKDDRPWRGDWSRNFAHEVLPGRNLAAWRGPAASAWDNPAIAEHLDKLMPDAVLVGGYNHTTMLRAIRHCIQCNVPYFLMCESHLESPRSRTRQALKDRLVRWVVRHMAGGLPTGVLAQRYLQHYGAAPDTLVCLPNVPDVVAIAEQTARLRRDRAGLRIALGLPDEPLAFFAGRLIPKKGAHLVLEALAGLPADYHLAIVGDGPEREALEARARQPDLAGRVHFAGFVEPGEMVRWYAASDLFVLPSQETWGVVVIEALAAGLPVLLSNGVGCHPDVVTEPSLGQVVANGDGAGLAAALRQRLGSPAAIAGTDAAWQDLQQRFSYPVLAERLVRHLRTHIVPQSALASRAAR